ncbi:coproporphyrinogen III oxidase, anaerobic [Tistlia consotensis]|uniref:Coproporphyrinogen-III oxidase n=1 Tax=Tistlia consotensis USBA 355 TaxID=560819 RepID=A0A1Y6B795_9PROT|nr:oxygen-independent coproporphyrinogen III oxidase [Tistlia consotensis]SME88063.1 coproporphyrinogen III oxidase, anaerobic [Tistlia consotensis USBA 355]SNR24436.1 coproporphyrinogen III oxidase, anaerobic [Tistlia consotensis]
MDASLLARYDRPVPRYTSYPTAPHFHAGVDAARYARWLGALPAEVPLSLYLHIPFCDTLCWFCGCNMRVVREHGPVAAYLDLLEREIDLVAERLPGRFALSGLHFGGGSPSLLRPAEIGRLMAAVWRRFDRAEGAEIAVEIDPRDLEAEVVEAFAAGGVTRASIGVQDFDPRVQKAVNRIQSFDCTRAAVEALRAAGIGSVNIDLLYGLPYQDAASVVETLGQALTLGPDRVALFGYAHVPWMKKHQRLLPEAALPDGPSRWDQAEAAAARLVAAGYRRIGLDHFARPEDPLAVAQAEGRLRRNFQGYTTDEAAVLLGLGASSIGSLPQGYVQNTADLPSYRRAVLADRLPVARGVELSEDDRTRRALIERLMCDFAVELDPAAYAAELASLEGHAADGLVELAGGRLAVTERGRPLVRSVAAAFDRYLAPAEGRHSRAV